jgi:hypothetical protein
VTRDRVLIDAELLVLLVVGLFDPHQIARHPNLGGRRNGYGVAEFDLLTETLVGKEWMVTPNLMSEASNLLRQIGSPLREDLTLQMHEVAVMAREHYTPSRIAAARPEFAWLGLPDAATLASLDAGTILLTADGGLHAAALRAGFDSVHFDHLRAARA